MADDELIICVPSKGSLHNEALALFERCMIPLRRAKGERSYEATLAGLDGVRVMLARADEVPRLLDSGQAHVGLTGLDLVREATIEGVDHMQVIIEDLGFGRAELVVGVPRAWIDVASMNDLVEVAQDVRHLHQRSIRIATKFPSLTRWFFEQHGLSDYRIVESLGATEGAPAAGNADLIIDLTSTGTTLETNGLKQLSDGVVLRSQACFVGATTPGTWSRPRLEVMRRIVTLFEAALAAQQQRLVAAKFASVSSSQRQAISGHLLESHWVEGEGSVHLRGRASHRAVPGLTFDLQAASATEARIDAPELLILGGSSYADRFEASLDHLSGAVGRMDRTDDE